MIPALLSLLSLDPGRQVEVNGSTVLILTPESPSSFESTVKVFEDTLGVRLTCRWIDRNFYSISL